MSTEKKQVASSFVEVGDQWATATEWFNGEGFDVAHGIEDKPETDEEISFSWAEWRIVQEAVAAIREEADGFDYKAAYEEAHRTISASYIFPAGKGSLSEMIQARLNALDDYRDRAYDVERELDRLRAVLRGVCK